MNLRDQLIEFEGWRNAAYPDPLTGGAPWTIGVGHTGPEVFKGLMWADDLISKTLDDDIAKKTAEVRKAIPWFDTLNDARKAVLVGMAFQMGTAGLLAFKRTLAAMRDERWAEAANGMCTSLWAKQTPKRARRLARQAETGDWQ